MMASQLKSIKLERTQVRRHFSKILNKIEEDLKTKPLNIQEVKCQFMELSDIVERLFNKDELIRNLILEEDDVDEAAFTSEFDTEQEYRGKWISLKVRYDTLLEKEAHNDGSSIISNESLGLKSRRNFSLPKLQLIKFDGNVKNWISFWGQFKKINDDTDIDPEDKFQYLLQATVPGTSARELVESFPPSGENYYKAVEQLKARFARDELLTEIYVRELLNLVLEQASSDKSIPLNKLYDKLETQLRALATLGVTSDKYAAMLQPLVESALPEETLRLWERHRTANKMNLCNNTESGNHVYNNCLQSLLDFLRTEVESEERVTLARTGFSISSRARPTADESKKNYVSRRSKEQVQDNKMSLPTAATILSVDKKHCVSRPICLFCNKDSHSTQDCAGLHKLKLTERKDFLKKKGACFICLLTGHNASKCKVFVNCIFCNKKHYAVMCHGLNKAKEIEGHNMDTEQNNYSIAPTLHKSTTNNNEKGKSEVLFSQQKCETLLQTLIVKINSNGKTYLARALLDSGSQRSYITKDCIPKLGIKSTGEEVVIHSLFGGVEMQQTSHNVYKVTLQNMHSDYKCTIPVLDQDTICNFVPRMKDEKCFTILKKKNIVLTDVGDRIPEVKILLGADIMGKLLTGAIEQVNEELVAVETHLGWTVMGRQITNQHKSLLTLLCQEKLNISDLWNLDVIGIRDPMDMKSRSHIEAEAVQHFKETVTINSENRYEVCLPWIEGHPELLDNLELAEKRLRTTTMKLGNKFNDYDHVFQDWLKRGIIENLPKEAQPSPGHYLPHHAVVKENSLTTKIRPVFDASAKDRKGNSLNSCLEKGPNLIERIPSLLMKFRQHNIGVTADIEKAFLQISLSKHDRDFLKFLWWDDYKSKRIAIYRHCRVVFGITSSPFLLNATIAHHLDQVTPDLRVSAEKLKNSFYVDNCVTSVDSVDELNAFVRESTYLMSLGKFNLRDWHFSSIREEQPTDETVSKETLDIVPVLGMLWDKSEDVLFCDISSVTLTTKYVTKRCLLSLAQRIFDCVGFTCPVTLIPKLLLQDTWELKLSWDEMLPCEISNQFYNWVENIYWLKKCRVPRRLCKMPIGLDSSECSIHVFCDASKVAYAACVFLRVSNRKQVSTQLISAKSRIAPRKSITIPRLELLAALIGSRLYVQVKEALNAANYPVYLWTDSMVALTWIKVEGGWNTFVGNRCKEINQATNKNDWHFLPGELNPADLPSRGCNSKKLYESRWWEGPAWLKQDEEQWPNSNVSVPETEVNAEKKMTVISAVAMEDHIHFTDSLLYFSKYSKKLRMTAWMFRFVHNSLKIHERVSGNLSSEEIIKAEISILKCIQLECFGETKSNSIKDLQVFKDKKGLMRVKTKLSLSNDPDDYKYPILLPSNHPIVSSIIIEKHKEQKHVGVQTLLVILRETYWILRGRKTVKNVLSKCVICKRFKTKHADTVFAPLPTERFYDCNAFDTTGIDLAGPLYLRNGNKSWIVLFTCAVYRAVHLELIESLSADAFIAALRRFIARRGRMSTIFTDNGTNFVRTNKLLKSLDWKEILQNPAVNKIIWKFNPPSAPWWGGWWERMVRLVKELLKRNLGLASVTYEELLTLLCDCESLINSRPLTYISDDTDSLQPLTPSMFLQPNVRSEVTDLDKIDSRCLNKRVKYVQEVRKGLRVRFRKEYLSMLVHRSKGRQLISIPIDVGDIVLIGDDNVKRIQWPLAIVLEMFPGKDGVRRVARLKTGHGEITRPVQRLYPLEIRTMDISSSKKDKDQIKIDKCEDKLKGTRVIDEGSFSRRGRLIKVPHRLDL